MNADVSKILWSILLAATMFVVVLAASTNVYGDSSNFGLMGWLLIFGSSASVATLIYQKME